MTVDYVNKPSGGYGELTTVSVEGDVKQVAMGNAFQDMGATGLKRNTGIIEEEFLPALRGQKSVKVFQEMSNNDPTVGALLFTIEKLLRQVDWTVVGDDNSPEQTEAVQFLEECMDDMSHSWDDLISEILSMLTYGWSWHEIVYKKRVGPWEKDPKKRSKYTDGKIGWRKMPIRSQETLFRWLFDEDGGVKGMVQIAPPKYDQIAMPIEKCLLFRTGTHKGNPEGRSILRNAYRPWYFKKRLEEFEAIGVERDLAGLPFAKLPSEFMQSSDPKKKAIFTAMKKMVSNVRRDEHEGIVIPSDVDPDSKAPLYDFQLLASGGSRTFNTTEIINRAQVDILSVVLADFIKLGHEQAGSYAMHVDKTGIFRAALNSMAKAIADVFNRYAIPRLFEQNAWKLDKLPKIEPSNVDPPNLAELGQFMTSMAGLGMTFFPDPDLDKYLRETAHLPAMSEEQEEMLRQMADQNNAAQYMDSAMQTQGMAQQHDMVVNQGMTPDQAMMQSQTPTPEQQANDPAMQQQQAQSEMDLQAKQQGMEMDAQGKQQELGHKQQLHEQTLAQTQAQGEQAQQMSAMEMQTKVQQMQLEIEQMEAQMGMDAKGKEQELKHSQAMSENELKSAKARSQFELGSQKKQGDQELKHTTRAQQLELRHKGASARQDLDSKKRESAFNLQAKRKEADEAKSKAREKKSEVKKAYIAPNPFRRSR